MQGPTKIRAVIYARVSSKEQEREGYSIDAQLKLLREYATAQGFEIVREFQEAESAKDAGRARFNEMLRYLEANPSMKHVLCEKTDRLSRNFKDIATLDTLMNEHGLVIHLVKENAQLSKDSRSHEKFMFGIKALIAKNYIDNLSEEVKKGMREKANQGEYPGGTIPYGYLRDPDSGRISRDPARIHHIVDLFELYAGNNMSLRALAAWARERGLTTPKPIVSRQLFDDVQRAFKQHNKPQLGRKKFAFGNLMTCGRCGAKITAERKKGKYVYYHCTGMKPGGCDLVFVKEATVVEQFADRLGPLVLTDAQADRILNGLAKRQNKSLTTVAEEQKRIDIRLGQINKWSEQAYLDKLDGTISAEHWTSLSHRWDAELIQLQAQQDMLHNDNANILPTAQRILELAQKLPALWYRQNPFEKRKLVDLLYSNCQLDGASLSATYRKPLSFIAEGAQSQQKRG